MDGVNLCDTAGGGAECRGGGAGIAIDRVYVTMGGERTPMDAEWVEWCVA